MSRQVWRVGMPEHMRGALAKQERRAWASGMGGGEWCGGDEERRWSQALALMLIA